MVTQLEQGIDAAWTGLCNWFTELTTGVREETTTVEEAARQIIPLPNASHVEGVPFIEDKVASKVASVNVDYGGVVFTLRYCEASTNNPGLKDVHHCVRVAGWKTNVNSAAAELRSLFQAYFWRVGAVDNLCVRQFSIHDVYIMHSGKATQPRNIQVFADMIFSAITELGGADSMILDAEGMGALAGLQGRMRALVPKTIVLTQPLEPVLVHEEWKHLVAPTVLAFAKAMEGTRRVVVMGGQETMFPSGSCGITLEKECEANLILQHAMFNGEEDDWEHVGTSEE